MDLISIVEMLELGSTEQKTSYVTPLKLMVLGKVMGLGPETKVIDFGCAKAKALILWSKYMQIKGVGVEINENFCRIASERIMSAGLSDRIKIIHADAATYQVPQSSYDVACCIGASMIWGGFRPTLQALRRVVRQDGQVVVGEPYYTQQNVPQELIEFEGDYHTEIDLLRIMHEEGYELKQIFRASNDDRDWYTAFWSQRGQEMYIKYMRPYEGWAVYLMHLTKEENV